MNTTPRMVIVCTLACALIPIPAIAADSKPAKSDPSVNALRKPAKAKPRRNTGDANPAPSATPSAVTATTADPSNLNILGWQAALDRAGFSPGVIDGTLGRKTTMALTALQQARDLPPTGRLDSSTLAVLTGGNAFTATRLYFVTPEDFDELGPAPKDWNEKAKLESLDYESLGSLLAERGHCTQATVARLNPGRDLNRLAAGDSVVLPNVDETTAPPTAGAIEVNLGQKTVRALSAERGTLALFHCSIAKSDDKLPRGPGRVVSVAFDPVYQFDPAMWPDVKNVKCKLIIPAGPRNPVGLAWIGLSLPGYGIHGTPVPEMIGKTGSHGCIRLANWDAVRLGKMVKPGIPVRFIAK